MSVRWNAAEIEAAYVRARDNIWFNEVLYVWNIRSRCYLHHIPVLVDGRSVSYSEYLA